MSPWDGASRWVNTVLLVVVGFVGFDTLFRLLEANERNVIVGFTRGVAGLLLSPFEGMFDDQEYLLTALIAVLGYALVAGIAMAVIRSVQASRRRRTERVEASGGASTWQWTGQQPSSGVIDDTVQHPPPDDPGSDPQDPASGRGPHAYTHERHADPTEPLTNGKAPSGDPTRRARPDSRGSWRR